MCYHDLANLLNIPPDPLLRPVLCLELVPGYKKGVCVILGLGSIVNHVLDISAGSAAGAHKQGYYLHACYVSSFLSSSLAFSLPSFLTLLRFVSNFVKKNLFYLTVILYLEVTDSVGLELLRAEKST